jgi:hypothetical protein
MSGWNPLMIELFLSMEVLCGFSKMIEKIGIIGDRAGQLGERENIGWKGWEWSILNEQAFDYVLAHMRHMESPN